jgi:hypothetical protein
MEKLLRTSKCDVLVGLKDGKAEEIQNIDKDWMINGKWAVINSCLKRT